MFLSDKFSSYLLTNGVLILYWRPLNLADARQLREKQYSPVAQSVEQLTVNQRVAGSSPAGGAFLCPVRTL